MFMPAYQIAKDVRFGDTVGMPDDPAGEGASTQSVKYKAKVLQSKEAETLDRQKERGVKYNLDAPQPLTLYHGTEEAPHRDETSVLWDGHHRLAHAIIRGKPKTEFPIEHVDDKIFW
jgi:hypothetical protein